MKVEITCSFGEKYLPTRRHRNPRIRHLMTCCDIEFTEVDMEDFPLAFIVQDYFSVYEGDTWEEYERNRTETNGDYRLMDIAIRTYKGKLYKARRFNYGSAIGTGFCPIEDAINDIRSMGEDMDRYKYRDYAYISPKSSFKEGVSVHLENNLDERLAELQEKASSYIFSNGKIWEECGEPMYEITTFGLGHNHGGTGMFIDEFYNPNISAANYFNALQRDQAIAYANKIAEGRGDTKDVGKFGKYENIIVKMPEMVRHNPQKEHAAGGDPFMESLENMVTRSSSVAEAGIGVIAMTLAGIR